MTPPPQPSPLHSLLSTHLDIVYSAALRQTRNPHLAQDITQSVFLIAARKYHSIPQSHTAAWLLKATRYVALTTLRAHRRRLHHERRAATETQPMPHAPTPLPETPLTDHLDAALTALPPSDRELLIRRYFQNTPIADIAISLHLTDNALSKRLERALQRLRRHLTLHGITTPAATLAATLLSTAIRPAPKSLAAHILSNAALTTTTPIGVLLMTASTKYSIAAALLLFIGTSLAFALPHHPAPAPILPIATTQHPPTTQQAPSLTLKPGVGIGDLKFGDSPERITEILGKPESITSNMSWNYPSKGIWLSVYPKAGLFAVMAASKGVYPPWTLKAFTGKTDTDLGIGSTREQIEAAYGKARRTGSAGTDTIVLYYDSAYIWFMLQSNHVIQIVLNRPPGALQKTPALPN